MRLRTRITPFLAAAAALTLLGTGISTATAADIDLVSGGKPPGGWTVNQEAFAQKFGGAGKGEPQGTVIADSGFRPYPHGFPLPNWGSADDFAESALIWGTPERLTLGTYQKGEYYGPAPLNSLALRRTFGNGVCRDAKEIDPKTGACTPILGAELLVQAIETAALGGHCVGFAASAAALYNGQLDANQVGASGLGINAANPMRNPAVQTITRMFGAQIFSPAIQEYNRMAQSPTDVVQTLVRELPQGQVPYVLMMFGEVGGHGITPYAITDRGDGVYDIAVYDNNFPLQAHAMTVDTKDDSFLYTSATNPNSPAYTWSSADGSRISLVPVDEFLKTLPCPVCRGEDRGTLLSFSSYRAVNQDEIGIWLVDAEGDPLSPDLYTRLTPLNPDTKENVSAPIITVQPGVEFGIMVQTGTLQGPQPFEIYAMSNGNSEYLLLEELASDAVTTFGVGGEQALFVSNKPASPRIQQLWDGKKESIDVNGHPLVLPAGVFANQNWDRAKKRVVYDSSAKRTLAWNVQVSGVDNSGDVNWVGLNVKVPAGARIVVDYAKASATVAPTAWVRAKDGSRTSITMQKVTQSLIDKSRDQLYAQQGPS